MKATMKWLRHLVNCVALIAIASGLSHSTNAQDKQSLQLQTFGIDFGDCVESIGVTLVPTSAARTYVPSQFILAGEGQPVTPLVARTA